MNFDFNMTLNFTYDGSGSQDCADQVGSAITNNLKNFFQATCINMSANFEFRIDNMGIFQVSICRTDVCRNLYEKNTLNVLVKAQYSRICFWGSLK
jgi:hypothetical protein